MRALILFAVLTAPVFAQTRPPAPKNAFANFRFLDLKPAPDPQPEAEPKAVCSIPLVNMLPKKQNQQYTMRNFSPPSNSAPMPVKLPAPPCDDRKQ